MGKFKQRWEITDNWQLLFPFFGLLALGYSAYRLSQLLWSNGHIAIKLLLASVLFYILLQLCLFFFKKLENKWLVDQKWEMIRIFIVFAITGSSSAIIGRPLMAMAGITKENLNPFPYWVLFVIIGLIFYQILLVSLGWLLGQGKFFWEFEKKMLKRIGFKRFSKD